MKEFTSTVTLTFDINNIEAKSQKQYIKALKEQYLDLYNVYLKDYEISNIEVNWQCVMVILELK